ncbi:MAG: creatininase family protein [Flammeovirgaceae bacterium]|nr:creatininase family protein [Flammeovirgaceae bacterium]
MENQRPYILAETNWKTVKKTDYKIAILPWGATEAHNYHLPYATDNIQCDFVAAASAKNAWENGGKVIVLPTVPLGLNTGQLDVKLCLNMNLSTQIAVLKDIVDVLSRQNIKKLVIMNGHGGNHFKQIIREMSFFYPDVFVCALNWFQAVDWNLYFDEPGDHAGEMETSAIMHIAPELVRPLSEAGDGKANPFKIKALKEGWVTTQRKWTKVTKDTGVGNPYKSSAEKGEKYLAACAENIGEFLVDLANTELEDLYEKE